MVLGPVRRLTARHVNLLLAVATLGVFATGLTSWAVGTGWSRWWTFAHATFGFMMLVLAPAKATGSARKGMRRRSNGRWLSVIFGVLITLVIGLGVSHSSGLWVGSGYLSSLWLHLLLAFVTVPFALWHFFSRPLRWRPVNPERRFVVGGAAAVGVAAVAVGATEVGVRTVGLAGADRRFTGSHEVGSHEPDAMPTVSWLNDTAPALDPATWAINVGGERFRVADLAARAELVDAVLDCTGGWWSEQTWQVVSVAALVDAETRSFDVISATGYRRRFPMSDAATTYLAIGYEGRPLRRGHGAPARIVAPGRRGPWWVKWVVAIEPTNTPWWAQLPFPAT